MGIRESSLCQLNDQPYHGLLWYGCESPTARACWLMAHRDGYSLCCRWPNRLTNYLQRLLNGHYRPNLFITSRKGTKYRTAITGYLDLKHTIYSGSAAQIFTKYKIFLQPVLHCFFRHYTIITWRDSIFKLAALTACAISHTSLQSSSVFLFDSKTENYACIFRIQLYVLQFLLVVHTNCRNCRNCP